ncbi:neutral zinc metallopeptidase [Agrococcus sp. HG114]|uniref:KPN_02809 family neutral zinc metallopeptidase n=1 Tax=Agrococcus sp. HG114 TaxID=2969757 RepID=UPI00215AA64F|nr:neutral zinc metallopeptidase [Agrococcus sp. HG114]MCR8670617.1 neutral zinc metallopeptidase [Agrococcus sp. HG114]
MTFRGDANFDTSTVSRGGGGGPGGGAIAIGGGGIITVILVLVSMFFGIDLTGLSPQQPIDPSSQSQGEEVTGCTGEAANDPANVTCRMEGGADSLSSFWEATFAANSLEYRDPSVQLFDRQVQTGCGAATSAVGPFYCPPDERIYIDTTFFQQMRDQFGASGGSLAQLYVLAHEWGHHIQNVTGDLQRVQQGDTGPQSSGVRSELQADCYAGAWIAGASQTADDDGGAPVLEAPTQQEMNDALNAAQTIGDDRLQQMGGGGVNPESWTHGSSEQRMRWLSTGYNEGVGSCNTWQAPEV